MLSFPSGNISDLGSIQSMLRTISEKNKNKLDIRIFEMNKIKSDGQSKIENPSDYSCKISGDSDHMTVEIPDNIDEKTKHKIDSALKMVGMLDLKFSYVKSTTSSKQDQDIRMSHSPDFMEKMKKWFESKIFVPDTNLIINNTISAIELASDPDLFSDITVNIPRFSILELERKSNGEKDKKKWEKLRESYLAFAELVYLQKKDNVGSFPSLPPQLLGQFPNMSSDFSVDSWIRKEIQDYRSNQRSWKLSQGGSDIVAPKSFILVTSDLIQSLASSSEGIDCIYVSTVRDKQDSFVYLKGTLKQVAQFLIILSMFLKVIDLTVNSTVYRFQGFWQGITNYDMINYRIKTSSTESD